LSCLLSFAFYCFLIIVYLLFFTYYFLLFVVYYLLFVFCFLFFAYFVYISFNQLFSQESVAEGGEYP